MRVRVSAAARPRRIGARRRVGKCIWVVVGGWSGEAVGLRVVGLAIWGETGVVLYPKDQIEQSPN